MIREAARRDEQIHQIRGGRPGEVEAGGQPADAAFSVSATGASQGLVLSLEHAGQIVWEDETSGVGFSQVHNAVTGLGVGPVVLAASTDSGTYQGRARA